MIQIDNPARTRMENGGLALGVGVRSARGVEIAMAMKTAGFDFLFIDLEHGAMSLDTATQIACAALGVGIAPLVRVPEGAHAMASRALDGGALGIVMPHVDSAEEARDIVGRQKFPPLGRRSMYASYAQLGFAAAPRAETAEAINAASLVTVMLESERAIANADDIAAVDGVDVLMIGTGDLTAELGLQGQPDHDTIVAAYRTVAEACERHGKWLGMGGVGADELMGRYIGMGVRFVLAGNDLGFAMAAASRRSETLREFER
jgi:2-keto-3-deoxy-L-rhamnonate aldolase RhmA